LTYSVAGGFIAEKTTWRWVFWATSIYNGVVQVLGVFLLKETYGPVLLKLKAEKLRKDTGNQAFYTEYDHPDRSLFKIIGTALQRPFRLLLTQPIVMVLALYQAYLYGVLYLV
jgi:sugar phosphate permease